MRSEMHQNIALTASHLSSSIVTMARIKHTAEITIAINELINENIFVFSFPLLYLYYNIDLVKSQVVILHKYYSGNLCIMPFNTLMCENLTSNFNALKC